MKKNTYIKLALLFLIVFTIKTIINLMMKTPFIIADEPCSFIKAQYFAENFRIATCSKISGVVGQGNPTPLYSIIISPLLYFFQGTTAYKAILVFNAFLVSSTIFPLFGIFKKFLGKTNIIYLFIPLVLFLPQIVVFEKTLMTESLFYVLSIWSLYFYLDSFTKNTKSTRNKVLAFLIGSLSVFTRPFGFIIPASITINEFFQSKNRKNVALIFVPLTVILTGITFIFLLPNANELLQQNAKAFEITDGKLIAIKAIIKEINSFSFATLVIPLLIFTNYINKKNSKPLNKIRWFLISFIGLSFLISTHHIYGYLIKGDADPGFITRYINVPLILIYTFTLIFLKKYKKNFINWQTIIISILILISLIFIDFKYIKHTLSPDIGYFYNTFTSTYYGLVKFKDIFFIPIIATTALLLSVYLLNKRKLLIALLTLTILIQSTLASQSIIGLSSFTPTITQYLSKKENNKILFLKRGTTNTLVSNNYWKSLVLSKNKLTSLTLYGESVNQDIIIKFSEQDLANLKNQYNYIITTLKLNLPIITIENNLGTGLRLGEKIYELK